MPFIVCPVCRCQISDRAARCPQCGLPNPGRIIQPPDPPIRAELAVPESGLTNLSPLQEIAFRQKLLLYALLVNLLSQLPISHCLQYPALAPLGIIGFLANAVFGLWCLYRLGTAMQMPIPIITFYAIGLFFPCISLGVIYVFSQRATAALQKAGVRVGLMGADLSTVR